MAHRRAAVRPHAWARWLAVPAALILDAAAAAYLAGKPFPTGVIVPEIVLFAAPLVVYGALAALVFRTQPLAIRLIAAAILLGIHAGLIALHTLGYVVLWSLPAPAAIRLAHRWSPLIPLLQLIWVPLLALPLAGLIRRQPLPAPRRSLSPPGRRDATAAGAPHPSSRERVQPSREVRVAPGVPGSGPEVPPIALPAALPAVPEASPAVVLVAPPVAVDEVPREASPVAEPASVPTTPVLPMLTAEVVPTALPEMSPVASPTPPPGLPPTVPPTVSPSASEVVVVEASATTLPAPVADVLPRTMVPAPVWFDELVDASAPAAAPALPSAAEVDQEPAVVAEAETPSAPLRIDVAATLASPAIPESVAPVPAMPGSTAGTRQDERTPAWAAEPPVDPYLVARLFEQYGPLLSRDRMVLVDWTPGPEAAVLCAAPRGMLRDQVIRLGARLARALDAGAGLSAPGPVRRLSLRGRDAVVVLTPLDGAILVAASRRRGALALLEVLSARVVPGAIRAMPAAAGDDAPATISDVATSCATRVETPAAIVDVLAPDGVGAAAMGELAGRLLAAIAAADGPVPDSLSVDLGPHRLMVHPVHPDARPPRFVAVVGGPERPGLLGRRTEQAARALREAS
jgi:hypothetical protein